MRPVNAAGVGGAVAVGMTGGGGALEVGGGTVGVTVVNGVAVTSATTGEAVGGLPVWVGLAVAKARGVADGVCEGCGVWVAVT